MPKRKFTPEEALERKRARQREYMKKNNYEQGKQYNKERGKMINFYLYRPQDNDMLEWLSEQENRSGYIKGLILADMKAKGKTEDNP